MSVVLRQLARRPALGSLRPLVAARGYCVPAPDLKAEIATKLEEMKAVVADKSVKGYTPDSFKAAFASNSVDISLLSDTLSFSDDARKVPPARLAAPSPRQRPPPTAHAMQILGAGKQPHLTASVRPHLLVAVASIGRATKQRRVDTAHAATPPAALWPPRAPQATAHALTAVFAPHPMRGSLACSCPRRRL